MEEENEEIKLKGLMKQKQVHLNTRKNIANDTTFKWINE